MTFDPNDIPLTHLQLDEPAHRAHIISAAIHAAPLALDTKIIPHAPGVYLLLTSCDFPAYQQLRRPDGADNRSMMLGGGYPIYAGYATDLAERCGRHRHKIGNATNLALTDFQLIALQTFTPATAIYAEAVLISELQPVWNQYWASGFGSKSQGKIRERGQRVTPWNRLHSLRHQGSRGSSANLASLSPKIEQHLAATVSSAHRLGI